MSYLLHIGVFFVEVIINFTTVAGSRIIVGIIWGFCYNVNMHLPEGR